MDPDALKKSQGGHGDEQEGSSVADKGEGKSGDRGDGYRHADVHEDMGEEEHHDPDGKETSQHILGLSSDVQSGDEQDGKG